MKCLIIKIFGKVQGVGFRAFVKENALKLNVSGYVRNEPDGSVYVVAKGHPERMDYFLNNCKQGPLWARVDQLEYMEASEELLTDTSDTFTIQH